MLNSVLWVVYAICTLAIWLILAIEMFVRLRGKRDFFSIGGKLFYVITGVMLFQKFLDGPQRAVGMEVVGFILCGIYVFFAALGWSEDERKIKEVPEGFRRTILVVSLYCIRRLPLVAFVVCALLLWRR